jgi:serine/threonine-protein kinase
VQLRAEARAYGRLNSPRIAQVHDYGETSDGAPYLVMEYVTGESLSHRLADGGSMTWPAAVAMAAQIADALRDAHAHGLVHRDVKPDNVLLTESGAKLVDFGICAMIGAPDADEDGRLLGTPAYLAPERIVDAPVHASADVYGVGVLLFRTLTGALPWPADTNTGLLKAHMFAEPPPMPEIDGLPPEVASICAACMDKDPRARPSSAELASTLWLATLAANTKPSAALAAAMPTSPAPASMSPGGSPAQSDPEADARPLLSPAAHFAASTSPGARTGLGHSASMPTSAMAVMSPTRQLRRPRLGRRRRPAYLFGLAMVALSLTLLGVAWGPLGAFHDGGGVPSASSACVANFTIDSDSGNAFAGRVTVTNAGSAELRGWSLSFAFPGDQSLTAVTAGTPGQVMVTPTIGNPYPAAITQTGETVVARASNTDFLRASESVAVPIAGRYTGTNLVPTAVALNGSPCQTQTSNVAPLTLPSSPPQNNGNGEHHGHGKGHGGGDGNSDGG